MKRAMAVAVAAAWLGVGLYGVETYASHYYTYRGFPPPHDPPGVAKGQLKTVRFFSRALGQERKYLIYLPPRYAQDSALGKRYPAFYVLHGSPGTPELFLNAGNLGVDLDTLIARRRARPMLVVFPNGSDGSYRSNTEWANTPHGRFEDFVLDVVHNVDRRFPTRADRRHRALAGNSEGAYAAVNIALHHLKTFGILESWSGYFSVHAQGPFKHASLLDLYRNSPDLYVPDLHADLHRRPVHAFLYTGDRDRDRQKVADFAHRLAAAGARVTFAVYKGHHSWNLWRRETPLMLRFASDNFGRR
jgi:enterochelin esterase-like enzyme